MVLSSVLVATFRISERSLLPSNPDVRECYSSLVGSDVIDVDPETVSIYQLREGRTTAQGKYVEHVLGHFSCTLCPMHCTDAVIPLAALETFGLIVSGQVEVSEEAPVTIRLLGDQGLIEEIEAIEAYSGPLYVDDVIPPREQ